MPALHTLCDDNHGKNRAVHTWNAMTVWNCPEAPTTAAARRPPHFTPPIETEEEVIATSATALQPPNSDVNHAHFTDEMHESGRMRMASWTYSEKACRRHSDTLLNHPRVSAERGNRVLGAQLVILVGPWLLSFAETTAL